MLFKISKEKTVFGVTLSSLYVSATLNTSADDTLSASLCAFATIPAFQNNEILSYKFDLIDHLPKYDEFGEIIDDSYIEVPYKADLTSVVVPLNMNAQAFDYLTIARLIKEHLSWIGLAPFESINLVDDSATNEDMPTNVQTRVDLAKSTVVITWDTSVLHPMFYELKFEGDNLPVSPITVNHLSRGYGIGGLVMNKNYNVSVRCVFSPQLRSNWVQVSFSTIKA